MDAEVAISQKPGSEDQTSPENKQLTRVVGGWLHPKEVPVRFWHAELTDMASDIAQAKAWGVQLACYWAARGQRCGCDFVHEDSKDVERKRSA